MFDIFSIFRRRPKQEITPFNFARNRYKAKKQWPPDLRELSQKQQFKYERKYKRRAALKWARPTWMKWTKIAQEASIFSVTVYALLFMDWSDDPQNVRKEEPFLWVRESFRRVTGSIFTHSPRPNGPGYMRDSNLKELPK
ncbi:hypothetical protein K469DRAFT_624332 [Zopfia rhizophila CBS 207.26]|uniref:Uncharacterized protein n=1 Tax=Zopfia rhizophila CBS 207.26 TaxID=1314779 RepID=A0A6A6EIX7_9PEZI|nr:hypothetical protein K469DRAFT_624332 [Zopfia rhizophila CBS 207.26]